MEFPEGMTVKAAIMVALEVEFLNSGRHADVVTIPRRKYVDLWRELDGATFYVARDAAGRDCIQLATVGGTVKIMADMSDLKTEPPADESA